MTALVRNIARRVLSERSKRVIQASLKPNRRNRGIANSTPIVIAGMFSTASGIGESARLLFNCLKQAGYQPTAFDLSDAFNQSDMEWASEENAGRNLVRSAKTILIVLNPPELYAAFSAMGLTRLSKQKLIGYWAWELSRPPQEWINKARHLDEIWVPSEFVKTAFTERLDKPVHVAPIPVGSGPMLATIDIDWETPKCLVMADGRSSFERKNLRAAVRIFNDALGDNEKASLTIKLRNNDAERSIIPQLEALVTHRNGIKIINQSLSNEAKWKLLYDHNILISAHRSEGFGLHLAEAMSIGMLVAATGWSGNSHFMTDANSVLFPYSFQPVTDSYGVYHEYADLYWAEVNVSAASKILSDSLRDKTRTDAICRRAISDIREQLNGTEILRMLQNDLTH